MVIDSAAADAMKANPAAAQEALAASYSEHLGIAAETIEICYTAPDVPCACKRSMLFYIQEFTDMLEDAAIFCKEDEGRGRKRKEEDGRGR